jgi:hypothetical protein
MLVVQAGGCGAFEASEMQDHRSTLRSKKFWKVFGIRGVVGA